MSYLGSKGSSGLYQAIINLMPPHTLYIEPFLGSGEIMKRKAPAQHSIGIDRDNSVIDINNYASGINLELHCLDSIEYLAKTKFDKSTLIYCDPPYVTATRKSKNRYKHEMTDEDHKRLLITLLSLECNVILSGYKNDIYDEMISHWFNVSVQAMTRGGVATETIWCNFQPAEIHYHTFAGKDFSDRQRIQRKAARWKERLEKLPPAERQAIMAAVLTVGTT